MGQFTASSFLCLWQLLQKECIMLLLIYTESQENATKWVMWGRNELTSSGNIHINRLTANFKGASWLKNFKWKMQEEKVDCNLYINKQISCWLSVGRLQWQLSSTVEESTVYLVVRIKATISPYRPSTSAKIKIRIMPTKSRGCCAVPRTPASPTTPMANPAARPDRPTLRPAPRWRNALQVSTMDTLAKSHKNRVVGAVEKRMSVLTQPRWRNTEIGFKGQLTPIFNLSVHSTIISEY